MNASVVAAEVWASDPFRIRCSALISQRGNTVGSGPLAGSPSGSRLILLWRGHGQGKGDQGVPAGGKSARSRRPRSRCRGGEYRRRSILAACQTDGTAGADPFGTAAGTQVSYYSGLGGLAISGILEWPVGLAVGAGTVIAQRSRPPSPFGGERTE
jgi:hypothetical protein